MRLPVCFALLIASTACSPSNPLDAAIPDSGSDVQETGNGSDVQPTPDSGSDVQEAGNGSDVQPTPDSGPADDASSADAGDVHTSIRGSGFDAYDGKTVHAVVWDGSTMTTLASSSTTVVAGAFAFGWPVVVDTSHYVFGYVYADENGDGTCESTEHTWSVILYNPVQSITPGSPAGNCSHF
jgi:hypothetical protein